MTEDSTNDAEHATSLDDLMAGPDEISEREYQEAAEELNEQLAKADADVIVKLNELLKVL